MPIFSDNIFISTNGRAHIPGLYLSTFWTAVNLLQYKLQPKCIFHLRQRQQNTKNIYCNFTLARKVNEPKANSTRDQNKNSNSFEPIINLHLQHKWKIHLDNRNANRFLAPARFMLIRFYFGSFHFLCVSYSKLIKISEILWNVARVVELFCIVRTPCAQTTKL